MRAAWEVGFVAGDLAQEAEPRPVLLSVGTRRKLMSDPPGCIIDWLEKLELLCRLRMLITFFLCTSCRSSSCCPKIFLLEIYFHLDLVTHMKNWFML
ncbi:Hypothetical predicted protein [Podarcis lilfordi]|uniref:Uncharacterized protein n=1 Tax=Podarcis lilfordi TaxID=74358 RepID=A0AA35NTT0_9SAUR|nr:Hypothetical predicted protein [Podarcis lilfordi]